MYYDTILKKCRLLIILIYAVVYYGSVFGDIN